jgi:hypothetical protein
VGVIPDLLPIAVHGQWQIEQCAGREQWHDFLEVLVWSNIVAAPRDGHWQVVGHQVRQGQVIAGGFAGAVWAARVQAVGLEAVMVAFYRAVDFIGADLMESQFVFACHLEQHVRTGDVGLGEHEWIQDALIDVGFGGEVDDRIDLVGLHDMSDQFEVGDVTNDNLEVWILEVSNQVFHSGSVGHFVKHCHLNIRTVLEDMTNKVTANKTATACDEQMLKSGHDDFLVLFGMTVSKTVLFVQAESNIHSKTLAGQICTACNTAVLQ